MDKKLRKQAETLADALSPSKSSALTGSEAINPPPLEPVDYTSQSSKVLIHELRVHQLELEIQNEELQFAQAELQATKNRYFELYHTAPFGYCTLNEEGRIVEANTTLSELLGRPNIKLLHHAITEFIDYLDQDTFYLCKQCDASQINGLKTCEVRFKNMDGRRFWARLTLSPAFDEDDNPTTRLVVENIEDRKAADEQLQLASGVFDVAGEGIMVTDSNNNILSVNPAFTDITGYTQAEVVGKNPKLLSSHEHPPEFFQMLWHNLNLKGYWRGELINRKKNGDLFNEIMHITVVKSEQGAVKNYVALFNDNTEVKHQQAQLENLAHFDSLTGLPNRVLMADRLSQAMIQARRDEQPLAVVFLDLDGFKEVNDNYGHNFGDELLVRLSKDMQAVLREGDTLARIGGDEFVVVFPGLHNLNAAIPLLNRLLDAASQSIKINSRTTQVSASLGVTFYPQSSAVDADHLLRQADQAMYQAKLLGKNRYELFNIEQNDTLQEHYKATEDIRNALQAEEFTLFYQPKINMITGKLLGVEALIRWRHPTRGLLSPAEFLPIIEEHPLSIEIGEWVLNQALSQVARWQENNINVAVSVNISAHQLMKANFFERLESILESHSTVAPQQLEIEILETSKLEDVIETSKLIRQCKQLGVTFSLDDFGTGYSSLTYLKQLPIKLIKIDQSFVKEMIHNVKDLTILEGVISLAAAFKHDILAEGVETVEQGEILLQLGCYRGQGFAIARPMRPEMLSKWLAEWELPPSWKKVSLKKQDELPLLFAAIEHRAWVLSVETYIQSDSEQTEQVVPLKANECRFGEWIGNLGEEIHGSNKVFIEIKTLHEQLHQLADEIIELHQQGHPKNAAKLLPKLLKLTDKMTKYLKNI